MANIQPEWGLRFMGGAGAQLARNWGGADGKLEVQRPTWPECFELGPGGWLVVGGESAGEPVRRTKTNSTFTKEWGKKH